eukprot:PITA_23344
MESVFGAAVRTEETPQALLVIVDVPGFRRKELRVQIDDQRNLIISGEHSVNEMEEITKDGGILDTMERGGHTFRKNQKLLTEDVNAGGKPQLADLSEQSKPDERSNPVKQQGLMLERPAVTQNDEGASLAEAVRPDDYKAKANANAEESKVEATKDAEDFGHEGQPISTHTQAVSAVQLGSGGDQSQLIQSKSKWQKKHDESYFPSPNQRSPNSATCILQNKM